MKQLTIIGVILLAATLACASAAVAKPKATPTAAQAVKEECATLERADPEAFDAIYGSSSRACINGERPEASDAVREAAALCRDERGHGDRSHEAFKEEHRSGKGGNDAFSRCVSAGVREDRWDDRDEFKNAAEECRAERGETPESWAAFEEKYGTNKDDPLWMYKPSGNAFGKCVSSKVGNRS